ncbi:MAG: hypothetical protein AUH72_09025 [Acidobacteria bacterium 13_1_40CM_4_65_8]|nr:MAG: hypothetical protein AUH41_12180 [Gemmatimonadetes bacterium 13_1_40CM_66_11]OLC81570.1 MAG: hypothetical protein AUH72_09025 [Acidobacteria bacterium 13_1_40CM_4_65_8]
MRLFLRPALAGLVLAALTGACGKESIAPKSLANPQATNAQLASLDTIFNAAPLHSFSAVSPSIHPTAPAPLPALALASAVNPLTQSSDLRPYARSILAARTFAQLIPQLSVRATAALFPVGVAGKTFEWDFGTLSYVATARTGAPVTGVRFILYAINEVTGYPANPPVEVGYLDLIDETGSGSPKLHVIVAGVGGSPVYVNYTVTLAGQTANSATITTAGYITNGASSPDSVRFSGSISASGTATSVTVTEDVSFDINSRDIHVRDWQRATVTQTSASLRLSFRFEHGGEVVTLEGALDVDETAGTVSGTITSKVDGGLFATCTVTGTSTSFSLTCTGADADGLNADEQAALHHLGDAVESIGTLFQGILGPAIGVLGA